MTIRKRSKRFFMWKYYTPTIGLRVNNVLQEETESLSRLAARYEISISSGSNIRVKVRCRKDSKVYCLCKRLGYMEANSH